MTGKQTVGLNSKAATIYAGQGRSELCGQQNSKNSQIQPKQPKNQNDNINNSHMSIWPVGRPIATSRTLWLPHCNRTSQQIVNFFWQLGGSPSMSVVCKHFEQIVN